MAHDIKLRIHMAAPKGKKHPIVFLYRDGQREPVRLGYNGNQISGRPDEIQAAVMRLISEGYTEFVREQRIAQARRVQEQDE